ncbi:hypothetical protein [Actinomadura sp. 6K520]|uniref:hypothetical protein n=1 Tax=Actinomadura sp. 6K520 TaxID=2530364 RepID=UPI0010535DCE|nr:hypothetical protein [Actinomadura sp. 6K520]TDE32201.1 hypothetical protein E1289_16540 [Actinomadura sp. 6K520]
MDDEALRDVQARFGGLIDQEVLDRDGLAEAAADREFEVDPALGTDEVADELSRLFRTDARLNRVLLLHEGERVAVSTRALVCGTGAEPGRPATAGAGFATAERSVLPGRSTRYRLLRFQCADGMCGTTTYASFYDDRLRPVCGSHGEMTFAGVVA